MSLLTCSMTLNTSTYSTCGPAAFRAASPGRVPLCRDWCLSARCRKVLSRVIVGLPQVRARRSRRPRSTFATDQPELVGVLPQPGQIERAGSRCGGQDRVHRVFGGGRAGPAAGEAEERFMPTTGHRQQSALAATPERRKSRPPLTRTCPLSFVPPSLAKPKPSPSSTSEIDASPFYNDYGMLPNLFRQPVSGDR